MKNLHETLSAKQELPYRVMNVIKVNFTIKNIYYVVKQTLRQLMYCEKIILKSAARESMQVYGNDIFIMNSFILLLIFYSFNLINLFCCRFDLKNSRKIFLLHLIIEFPI